MLLNIESERDLKVRVGWSFSMDLVQGCGMHLRSVESNVQIEFLKVRWSELKKMATSAHAASKSRMWPAV